MSAHAPQELTDDTTDNPLTDYDDLSRPSDDEEYREEMHACVGADGGRDA